MESDREVSVGRESLARLTIYSETSSAEDIAARLGGTPDQQWNKGQPNKRGDPYTTTAVSFQTAIAADESPAAHLADLVTRVEPLQQQLAAEAAAGNVVRLKLAVFEDADNITFVLPADLLARVAALDVELELDIYDV